MPTRQRSGQAPADDSAHIGASSHIRLYLGIASFLCLGSVYVSRVSQPDTSNLQNIYRPHEEEVHRYLFEQSNSKGSSKYISHENSNLQVVSHGEDNNQHRRQMLPSFDVIQKAVGASKSVLRTKQMTKSTQNDNSESASASSTAPSRISLLNIFSYRNAGGGESSSKSSKSKEDSKSKSSSDSKKDESSKSKSSSDSKSKSSSKSKSDSKSKKKEGSSDDDKEYDAKSKTKKYGDVFQDIVDEMMEEHGMGKGKGKGKGGNGGGGHYDQQDDKDYSDTEDKSKQDGGKGRGKGSSNGDGYSWNQDEKYDDVNYEWTVFGKGKGGSSGGYSKSGKQTKMTSKSSKLTKGSKGKGYYPPPPPPPPSPGPPTPRPPTRRPPTRRPPTMRPPSARPPTNPGPPDHGNQRIRYLRQKRKWNQYDIADYDITTTNCGGMGRCDDRWRAPKRVSIRKGNIIDVTYAESGEPVESIYRDSAFTVNLLYEYLGIALGRNAADIVRTRYNRDYNYPSYAEIFDADGAGTKGRSFNAAPGWRAADSQQVVDATYTVTDFCDCNEGCCSDGPGLNPTPMPTPEPTKAPVEGDICTDSGGTVTERTCCAGQVYPNTCSIGACGCPPDSSEPVPFCDCDEGFCWDGTRCIGIPTPFPVLEPTPAPIPSGTDMPTTPRPTESPVISFCVEKGGIVTEKPCCEGTEPFPNTCNNLNCDCSILESDFVLVCDCGSGFCWDGNECVERDPTPAPVPSPTVEAPVSNFPSDVPSRIPTLFPSSTPSVSLQPSTVPSQQPTGIDDVPTTQSPTASPSSLPSTSPTVTASSTPTASDVSDPPSSSPTVTASSPPTTPEESDSPSFEPSILPSFSPSAMPTQGPTDADDESQSPSSAPTFGPTLSQSYSLSYSASFVSYSSFSNSMSNNVTDVRRHRNRRRAKARRQRRRLQSVRSDDGEVEDEGTLAENDAMISVTEEDIQLDIGGLRYQR